ncbi:MAG: diguanylate cyclase [Candidatus Eisenbacteria bacterium]|nr:diguanylate cyclase [Candidatus Eisenbacteria bacterium]
MQKKTTKRRARVSSKELLQRLIPIEGLDRDSREEYLRLLATDDDEARLRGARNLLETLCEQGYLRRMGESSTDGAFRVTYRNLATLDTISVTLPRSAGEPSGREGATGEASENAADAGAKSGVQTASGRPETDVRALSARPLLPRSILEAVAASSRRIDLSSAMSYLYDLLIDNVGSDRAAVFMSSGLSDSPAGRLSELEEVFRWTEDETIAPRELRARVEETGEVASIPDMSERNPYSRTLPRDARGSLVVSALRAEAYVYGTLQVWSERPHAFTSDDIAMVDFVAEFMGGLIKRRLEIEELIFVDQTSQIHNRRYFDEQLAREVERCRRTGNAMALLVADLDDFKLINDTMGHAAGDSVLRQVGRILSENARQLDIVARIGGEEFGVILPNVERKTARAVAERMRTTISAHSFVTGLRDRPTCDVTVSIGGALYPLDAKSRADLMDKADRIALYEAKGRGKNRVLFWEDVRTPGDTPISLEGRD